MRASCVASRLNDLHPAAGLLHLRPDKKPEAPIEERRTKGFTGKYAAVAKFAIEHRWKVAIGSLAFLVLGAYLFSQLQAPHSSRMTSVLVLHRRLAAQRRQLRALPTRPRKRSKTIIRRAS